MDSLFVRTSARGKDPACPNCGGRSFSPIDPSDYYECELCERPTVRFHDWYSGKWPDTYKRWAATERGRETVARRA